MKGAWFLPLIAVPLAATVALAAPGALWVAPLEPGTTLEEVHSLGVVVQDRFPDALILADARSAETLLRAGYTVQGPFPIEPGHEVTLLRPRGEAALAAGDLPGLEALAGVQILWSDGRNVLVQSASGLPEAEPILHLTRQALSPVPILTASGELPASLPLTAFDPLVSDIVAQVDSVAYFPWIRALAGADPVLIGGQPHTFATRYSKAAECDLAEQYVYESFQAMGFTQVEYDTFTVSGYQARNVIATLPGTTTPDDIIILCGHLDSTSPQAWTLAPGANDNASGTAAVLAGADILSDYAFRSTIRFIAFTGEEQGLVGSQHYAAQAQAQGDQIRGVVNCDMIAWHGANYKVDIEGEVFADPLMQIMRSACLTFTGLTPRMLYNAWGSDHVPFLNLGFPAFLAIETDYSSYPCYHQTCDTADRNQADFGVEITRACLATVAQLAGPSAPVSAGTLAAADGSALSLAAQPNPFRGSTTVEFRVPAAGPVTLAVHDVAGRRVRTLHDGPLAAGPHRQAWDGRSDDGRLLPAGTYFVRIFTEDGVAAGKLVRLR